MDKTNAVIKIQRCFRNYSLRKYNKSLKDGISFDLLSRLINSYSDYISSQHECNKNLTRKNKKIRMCILPSEISENIVKFAIFKKYNVMPSWDTESGDLELYNLKIEIKGSINLLNSGPCSFGPSENWDIIYFIDAKHMNDNKYDIWEIKLSNASDIWKSIKVNKTQTYEDQCKQKRRPRINFNQLIQQVPKKYISIMHYDHNDNS